MASCCSSSAMACFLMPVLLCSCLGLSCAAVLKVGDDVGWTIGKIDYGTWASKKTFHVGDTLLFVYNNSFHNVLEVRTADYDGCTQKSPIAKYTTGNDSIAIKSEGNHYFICGFPGHCSAGQKLKITALAKGPSAAPSTSPAAAPSPSIAPTLPGGSGESPGSGTSSPSQAPNSSNAAVAFKGLGLVVFTVAVSAVSTGFMIMFK